MHNKSVRLLILNKADEILLVKRTKDEIREPQKLILPGGRVEKHEFDIVALVREIKEELGLTICPHDAIFLGKEDKTTYDNLRINFYFYNKSIDIEDLKVESAEVESIAYYDLFKVTADQIAFNEFDLFAKYYKMAYQLAFVNKD